MKTVDADQERISEWPTDREHPREYAADSKFLRLPVLYNYIGSLFFEGHL